MSEEFMMARNRWKYGKNWPARKFRYMTAMEIQNLKVGDIVYYLDLAGEYGAATVAGEVKTWKRKPEDVRMTCRIMLCKYFKSGFYLDGGWFGLRLIVEVKDDE